MACVLTYGSYKKLHQFSHVSDFVDPTIAFLRRGTEFWVRQTLSIFWAAFPSQAVVEASMTPRNCGLLANSSTSFPIISTGRTTLTKSQRFQ